MVRTSVFLFYASGFHHCIHLILQPFPHDTVASAVRCSAASTAYIGHVIFCHGGAIVYM